MQPAPYEQPEPGNLTREAADMILRWEEEINRQSWTYTSGGMGESDLESGRILNILQ